jgi:hypothetical protein
LSGHAPSDEDVPIYGGGTGGHDPVPGAGGGGNGSVTPPAPPTPNPNVPAALQSLIDELKARGINIDHAKIVYDSGRFARAWVIDGKIYLRPDQFDKLPLNDQRAVLAHELIHFNDDLPISQTINRVEPPHFLGAPSAEIENWIREDLRHSYPTWSSFPINMQESMYLEQLTVTNLVDENWYRNEIHAIELEKRYCPDVSQDYGMEREFKLWRWNQILEQLY